MVWPSASGGNQAKMRFRDAVNKATNSGLRAMQTEFQKHCKSETEPVKHDKTAVLLLQWENAANDMPGLDSEVSDLENVFKSTYGFEVERRQFKVQKDFNPALQAQLHLLAFLNQHRGERRLYLIYYAGHGHWEQGMRLAGRYTLTDHLEKKDETQLVWNQIENCLTEVSADILLIFDCCHAGALLKPGRGRTIFEFLGACAEGQRTPKPGPDSFTRAMIWALQNLAERKPNFDSHELRQEILNHPSYQGQAGHRDVVLQPRYGSSTGGHIYIELQSSGAAQGLMKEPEYSSSPIEAMPDFLDVRLSFQRTQSMQDIRHLASSFSEFVSRLKHDLGLRHVDIVRRSPDPITLGHTPMHEVVATILQEIASRKSSLSSFVEGDIEASGMAQVSNQTSPTSYQLRPHTSGSFGEAEDGTLFDTRRIQHLLKTQMPNQLLTPKSMFSDPFSGEESDAKPSDRVQKRKRSGSLEIPTSSPSSLRPRRSPRKSS